MQQLHFWVYLKELKVVSQRNFVHMFIADYSQ